MSKNDKMKQHDAIQRILSSNANLLDWRWKRSLELMKGEETKLFPGIDPNDWMIRDFILPFLTRRDNGETDAFPDETFASMEKVISVVTSTEPETIRLRHLMEAAILGEAKAGELIPEEFGMSSWEQMTFEFAFYNARGFLQNQKLLKKIVFYPIDVSTDESQWALKAKMIAYKLGNDELQKWTSGKVSKRAWLIEKKTDSAIGFMNLCVEHGLSDIIAKTEMIRELLEFAEQVRIDVTKVEHRYGPIHREFYLEEDEVEMYAIPE